VSWLSSVSISDTMQNGDRRALNLLPLGSKITDWLQKIYRIISE